MDQTQQHKNNCFQTFVWLPKESPQRHIMAVKPLPHNEQQQKAMLPSKRKTFESEGKFFYEVSNSSSHHHSSRYSSTTTITTTTTISTEKMQQNMQHGAKFEGKRKFEGIVKQQRTSPILPSASCRLQVVCYSQCELHVYMSLWMCIYSYFIAWWSIPRLIICDFDQSNNIMCAIMQSLEEMVSPSLFNNNYWSSLILRTTHLLDFHLWHEFFAHQRTGSQNTFIRRSRLQLACLEWVFLHWREDTRKWAMETVGLILR